MSTIMTGISASGPRSMVPGSSRLMTTSARVSCSSSDSGSCSGCESGCLIGSLVKQKDHRSQHESIFVENVIMKLHSKVIFKHIFCLTMKYVCNNCNYRFTNNTSHLQIHIEYRHEEINVSTYCFKIQNNLLHHIQSTNESIKYL